MSTIHCRRARLIVISGNRTHPQCIFIPCLSRRPRETLYMPGLPCRPWPHPQLMHTHPQLMHTHPQPMHTHPQLMHTHPQHIHSLSAMQAMRHTTAHIHSCRPRDTIHSRRPWDTPQLIFIPVCHAGRGTRYSFPYAVQAVGHTIHSHMPCRLWDTPQLIFIPVCRGTHYSFPVCRAGWGTYHSSYSFPYAVQAWDTLFIPCLPCRRRTHAHDTDTH